MLKHPQIKPLIWPSQKHSTVWLVLSLSFWRLAGVNKSLAVRYVPFLTKDCFCPSIFAKLPLIDMQCCVYAREAALSPIHTTSDTQRQSSTIPFISMESWRFLATQATESKTVGDRMGRVQGRDKVQNPSTLCKWRATFWSDSQEERRRLSSRDRYPLKP